MTGTEGTVVLLRAEMSRPSRSAILGEVDLSADRLAETLETIAGFTFSCAYSDFTVGEWNSCMLWNPTAHAADALLAETSSRPRPTELGTQLPYVRELLETVFDMSALKYARLMRIKQDSLVLPHIDFLEFSEPNTRLHLPLQTDEFCFYAEEKDLFQMEPGEIWFLDVTRVHSAASFSPKPRINLVLDFDYTSSPEELVRAPFAYDSPRQPRSLHRPPLSPDLEAAVLGMSELISTRSFAEVTGLLAKLQYSVDVRADEMYRWLEEIVRRCGEPDVIARGSALVSGCMHARSAAGESPYGAS